MCIIYIIIVLINDVTLENNLFTFISLTLLLFNRMIVCVWLYRVGGKKRFYNVAGFYSFILFYSFRVSIYKFEVYTDSKPYFYTILIYKDKNLISWEVAAQIVEVETYFGLMLQPCKCNQRLKKVILIITESFFKF